MRKVRRGNRIVLKANEEEDWPREEGVLEDIIDMPWGTSVLVRVDERYRQVADGDSIIDDGLREVTADQVEGWEDGQEVIIVDEEDDERRPPHEQAAGRGGEGCEVANVVVPKADVTPRRSTTEGTMNPEPCNVHIFNEAGICIDCGEYDEGEDWTVDPTAPAGGRGGEV